MDVLNLIEGISNLGVRFDSRLALSPDEWHSLGVEANRLIPRAELEINRRGSVLNIRRGGYFWNVAFGKNQPYELVPPAEYYSLKLRNSNGSMLPQYMLFEGGLKSAEWGWQSQPIRNGERQVPTAHTLDMTIAGDVENKVRFEAVDDQVFAPRLVGFNIPSTPSIYKPDLVRKCLTHPRLVIDVTKNELAVEWLDNTDRIKPSVLSIGHQIIDLGHNKPQILNLYVDRGKVDTVYTLTAEDEIWGSTIVIPHLIDTPTITTDLGISTIDNWVSQYSNNILLNPFH